jgi:hypothetical protein
MSLYEGETMPRPVQCWYLSTRDIVRYCDLTAHSVDALHRAGQLKSDDIHSLLLFTASHLKDSRRKSLKETLAKGKFHYTTDEQSESWDYEREPGFELNWTVNSKSVSEALGITINSWHVGVSREVVNPADLFSLLRFACLYARPDIRATIAGAVFSKES